MTRKTKRRLAIILVLLILAFAGLNLLAWNHARSMMDFARGGTRTPRPEVLTFGEKVKTLLLGVTIPRPASDMPPAGFAPQCRRITIEGPDDILLETWYCPRGEGSPLVILFHGYAADKTVLLPEARAFLELGMSVLLVDFRGSGGSSESYTTIGYREAEDVAAVVAHARERLSHPRVVLYGQSMGAAAVLRAIHSHGVEPDGVIVEAVFDTMLNTVRNRFRAMGIPSFPGAHLLVFWGSVHAGFSGFRHNPVDYAGRVSCPILFLHGADDPRARVEEGRRVFDAVPGPKTFREFRGTAHESCISRSPEEWREAVLRCLSP